jgi:hypothetical protein
VTAGDPRTVSRGLGDYEMARMARAKVSPRSR